MDLRTPAGAAHPVVAELGITPGTAATFVQLSSRFCRPCRAAHQVLERVAATTPGVVHVDVDVSEHLALGERLDVRATPTVLVLDGDGVERARVVGAPTLAQARAAVAALSTH
ncbi:thioredoxin family protein [Cellulomonas cellasea]|uniref:Thiol-disulfide isomerase/thioredoxin n=1 Tax=Cellulomonas cellasea TaxID=43670 RepID=A0A7W4UJ32_9CELL|nr:thioredoxin family protein [Cellulomonas cellasea]MBB2925094.1 thiol-disulfide isomerase/thioredoxin [Cellulomonas cellasea]